MTATSKSASKAGKSARPRRIPLLVESAIVMMCVLCVLIALTYSNFRHLEEANDWNIHTHRVLEKIVVMRAALGEEESRLRGFALTGDFELLSDVYRVQQEATDTLSQLMVLTRDRPQQQQRLDTFGDDYQNWRGRYATVKAASLATARRISNETGPRRVGLVRLENALNVIENTERALLVQRAQVQELSRHRAAMYLLCASICAVTFTAVFVVLLGGQVRAVENSNERLTASQAQLQTVLEHAPLILYSVDLDEKFTLMTGKGAASVGLTPAAVGKNITQVISHSYDYEPVRAALRGHANVSRSVINDLVFETNRLPLRDASGEITGMIGVSVDISQSVHASEALRESEARFRSVIESVQEVVFQIDEQGCWSFLNPAWRLALGHDVDWSLGKAALDFVYPEDHDQTVAFFNAPGGRKDVKRGLVRFITRNGHPRWMDVQMQVQRDESGAFLGAAGTFSDITDRKVAQEELLATTMMQRAILNSSNYSIIAVDPNGIVQSFNRAAQKMLGYKTEEVAGKETLLRFHAPAEIEERARELSEELGRPIAPGLEALVAKARDGAIEEREWNYVRRDGSQLPVRLSISELRGVEGQVSGFLIVGYDLTETRRAESLKNEFVSVVSHELRTPLTSIRGALGLLAGGVAGELPKSARDMIEIARKNSDRLVLLINDILDIEKIESGKMRFETKPVKVRTLLENAVEQNAAYGDALEVKLVLDGAESMNEWEVQGDEDRLQQVLSNLISNACKFTPAGGSVHIGASNDGENVRISVLDQGPGVPAEFVPRLFEKFAQADSTSTRKQGGTGLGLAIARAIVEKHDGSLDYVSPPAGKSGACFALELPLPKSIAPFVPPVPTSRVPMGRVLICEDEIEVAQLLALIISKSGYDSDIATSIAIARDKLKSGDYVGLTLDMMFPDGDGLDFLAEIRADAKTRELPVIVVSLNSRSGQLHGDALDVLDWLRKPIDAGRLLNALALLQQHDSPRILHVEDDADVRHIVSAILGDSARITPASNLAEARSHLVLAKSSDQPFDLAILDIGLPDGSGLDLVPLLSSSQPPIQVIMFSASESSPEDAQAVNASLVKSRTSNEVLKATIQRLLQKQS
jgi:PAS domain S-box-containing protein